MTRGFLRFLRRNTIALLALFLALGGTTYAASTALIGKNTVASPQVVNGSLKTKDLSAAARKALKGNRGLRGLRGVQGVQGAKGATGAQGIQGPAGPTLAGADNSGGCDPNTATFETCATVSLNLPVASKVALTGSGHWHSDAAAGTSSSGTCRLAVDGAALLGASQLLSENVTPNEQSYAVTGLTAALAVGSHTFTVECNQSAGSFHPVEDRLLAIMVGG
jgi:hypothetical protein